MTVNKAFLAIKYHPDNRNRALIDALCNCLMTAGYNVRVIVRDVEAWGTKTFTAQEMMAHSFALIRESKVVLIEASEKGVGIGIEAGYAFAFGIPIIVIARIGTEISNSLRGVAREILFYDKPDDLIPALISLAL